MTLLELMRKHQTDKAKHRFDIPYGFFFDDERRHQVRSVLELGVKRGASLRVWEEYFPQAKIFGVELDPTFARCASPRSQIFIGNQTDPTVLSRVAAAADFSFDLIIDDGSHMSDDQVGSLMFLWQFLKPPHGVYAIEDLHAHLRYPQFTNDGCRYPPVSDMVVRLIEAGLARKRCRDTAAGMYVHGPIAFFVKHTDGPAPKFEQFLKEGARPGKPAAA